MLRTDGDVLPWRELLAGECRGAALQLLVGHHPERVEGHLPSKGRRRAGEEGAGAAGGEHGAEGVHRVGVLPGLQALLEHLVGDADARADERAEAGGDALLSCEWKWVSAAAAAGANGRQMAQCSKERDGGWRRGADSPGFGSPRRREGPVAEASSSAPTRRTLQGETTIAQCSGISEKSSEKGASPSQNRGLPPRKCLLQRAGRSEDRNDRKRWAVAKARSGRE